MRIALLIQYDGSHYHGWQIQPDDTTIQSVIESALAKVFSQSIGIMGSGRTDAGVHAHGQVAHFDISESSIPPSKIWAVLNQHLPQDIRIIASQKVADDFHSRFMANQREYRYELNTNYNILHRNSRWFVRFPLQVDTLTELSGFILGEHDFSSFCYAGTETENMVCTIKEAKWESDSHGSLSFEVKADRFLHHMVRMLVGSMIEVARGKWTREQFEELLKNPNRKNHAVTAPATGLALVRVRYPKKDQPIWTKHDENLVTIDDKG